MRDRVCNHIITLSDHECSVYYTRIESLNGSRSLVTGNCTPTRGKTTDTKGSDEAHRSDLSSLVSGRIWEAFSCFVTFTHLVLNTSVTSFSGIPHINVTFL